MIRSDTRKQVEAPVARLTAAKRHSMPASEFALGKGHYPINDEEHGRKAVQMASHAGPAAAAKIKRKVHSKFPDIAISGLSAAKGEAHPDHNDGHHANAHPGEEGWESSKSPRHAAKNMRSGRFK